MAPYQGYAETFLSVLLQELGLGLPLGSTSAKQPGPIICGPLSVRKTHGSNGSPDYYPVPVQEENLRSTEIHPIKTLRYIITGNAFVLMSSAVA